MADVTRRAMLNMLDGFRVSQMVAVAARLGVADYLKDGPKTVQEIAHATGSHEDALYRLLRALACMGVFAEDDGRRFELTSTAEWLRSDVPGSLRVAAEVIGEEWSWQPWGALLWSVRTGETAFDHLYGRSTWDWFAEHAAAGRLFDRHMDAITATDAAAVVAAYDFAAARTIVDVAGGRGVLLAAILKAHPAARGVLLNLPAVVASAGEMLDRDIAERIELVAGDMFDAIPDGGDVYILKNILHDWDDDAALAILATCRRGMPDTATLLVIEHLVQASTSGRCQAHLADVQMMVRTGGRNRTLPELRSLLGAAGFDVLCVIPTAPGPEIVEAR